MNFSTDMEKKQFSNNSYEAFSGILYSTISVMPAGQLFCNGYNLHHPADFITN